MEIRRASGSDAEGIARLHIASWQATYRDELPAEFLASQDLDARAAKWRAQIGDGTTVVLLAVSEDGLLGFVAGGPSRDADADGARVFEIHSLHAAPGRHGHGIGAALFVAAVAVAGERGAAELSLWVVDSNANARGFYERRGMRADGARQRHEVAAGASLQEVRYRMSLR